MDMNKFESDYVFSEDELRDILIETRTETGMNRKVFAAYFKIPYRTLQDWELGNRKMPEYLLRLMLYRLKTEGIIGKKEN